MTGRHEELGPLTWPEASARVATSVLAVPLGATEQHGPHLPLATDTTVAVALAQRLADRRPEVVVAPALPYGSSGEHAGFPGTLSIGQEALTHVVVELVRSADDFAATLIVSGHGGNADALGRAVAVLTAEGRRVRSWSPSLSKVADAAPGFRHGDAHAGWVETSVMLALDPTSVRVDQAAAGATAPIGELAGALRTGGVLPVSANGVLGDPAGADPAAGEALLEVWTADLVATLDGWR